MRPLQPSPLEKKRTRNGYYQTFAEMPRLVRDWAKVEGCGETRRGIRGPIPADAGVIDRAALEGFIANGKKW